MYSIEYQNPQKCGFFLLVYLEMSDFIFIFAIETYKRINI